MQKNVREMDLSKPSIYKYVLFLKWFIEIAVGL